MQKITHRILLRLNLAKARFNLFTPAIALGILLSVFVFLITHPSSCITPPAQATVGDVTIDQSVGGSSTLGIVTGQKFVDTANSTYFIDPAATGDSLVLAGTATASGNLTVGNTNAIRSAFGPLSLQYKSGLNAWTTGITLQDTTGNVGIGTTGPTQKLTVAGTVESTTGGFKFPDATTQTTAATASVLVQHVFASTTTFATGTTIIPNDDTIPQNTEGDEYLTATITPKSATNKLKITVSCLCSISYGSTGVLALFQDSIANALYATSFYNVGTTYYPHTTTFVYQMTAGTTSATTIKLRGGDTQGYTFTINGTGGRKFGGVAMTSITIEEYTE